MPVSRLKRSRPGRFSVAVVLLFSVLPRPALASSSDTDFHLKWAWAVAGNAIGLKGLEVVDLDADGETEILASASTFEGDRYWYVLRQRGTSLEQIYTTLPQPGGVLLLAAGQEIGGSRIIVADASSLTVYDGATRRLRTSLPIPLAFYEALAVADIDGDGDLDAVLSDGFDLWVYDLSTGSSSIKYGFGAYDIAVGQIDSDPQLEIALAGNPLGGFVLDGASLAVDWADVRGFGMRVRLANFDLDSEDEVASLIDDWQGVRVQDPATSTLLWEIDGVGVAALAAANLDEDSDAELVWAEDSGDIHVVDGATATELRVIPSESYSVTALAVGDTDGDEQPDIVWGSGWNSSDPDKMYVARGDATVIAASTHAWSAPFPGFAVGDFAGEGKREIAVAAADLDEGTDVLSVLVFDVSDGRYQRSGVSFWGGWANQSGGGVAAGQLDEDAALELCIAGGTAIGCYDGADFAEQWRVELPHEPFVLAIGEIDGDPLPEVVAGTDGDYAYAFEGGSGWLKWRTPEPESASSPLDLVLLADIAGNGNKEVVATAGRFGSLPLTTFSGDSGQIAAGPWSLVSLSMTALRVAGSPEELFIGRSDGSVAPVDPLTGVVGPTIASFPGPVYALGFADFNRDGTLDTAARLDDHFEILDGETGLALYESPFLGDVYPRFDSMLVGDLSGSGVPEILVVTGNGLALFESPLFNIFADGFESGDTSNW